MKRIAVLGSTGSIGTQALDILGQYPTEFEIKALCAYGNIDVLEKQALRFHPGKVGVVLPERAKILQSRLPHKTAVLSGRKAMTEIASLPDIDMVLVAVVGISGLKATIAALEAGNCVALANKESLVAGGQLVMDAAKKTGTRILPVDSEHSAIFQCLQGNTGGKGKASFWAPGEPEPPAIRRILLTASGGPFRGIDRESLRHVRVSSALKHPRWNMGKKVTVDSATLINKGLEVIEARWLFGVDLDQIEVLVHPQSIIHSMVEFPDGAILAQMGMPDMRLPILYAFTWPKRFSTRLPSVDFFELGSLTFEKPDVSRFPGLALAMEAARIGGTMPAVMNAANEVAVQKFLEESISFPDIPRIVEKAMGSHRVIPSPSLEDILGADQETRDLLQEG